MLKSFLQPLQRQRSAPFGRRAYSVPVPPNKKVQLKPLDYLQPEHESVPRRFERDRPRLWRRVLTARDYTGSSLSPYTIAPARS
jgi:hypothetical protein